MVRRLVEEQDVGLAVEDLRDEDAQFVAAREGVHLRLVLVGRDTETDEGAGRLALGHVAVLFGDRAFELAEPDGSISSVTSPARSLSFSCIAPHRALPMMTVSVTR